MFLVRCSQVFSKKPLVLLLLYFVFSGDIAHGGIIINDGTTETLNISSHLDYMNGPTVTDDAVIIIQNSAATLNITVSNNEIEVTELTEYLPQMQIGLLIFMMTPLRLI